MGLKCCEIIRQHPWPYFVKISRGGYKRDTWKNSAAARITPWCLLAPYKSLYGRIRRATWLKNKSLWTIFGTRTSWNATFFVKGRANEAIRLNIQYIFWSCARSMVDATYSRRNYYFFFTRYVIHVYRSLVKRVYMNYRWNKECVRGNAGWACYKSRHYSTRLVSNAPFDEKRVVILCAMSPGGGDD